MKNLKSNNIYPFQKYMDLLLKWNKTYNLTAIKEPSEIIEKHFNDSLALLPYLPNSGTVLDIGTGPGFPGIPIKIEKPNLNVTLIEATKKKCNFCETVIRELSLKNINVANGRVEDKKIQDALGKFDIVVSRATFALGKLVEMSLPYMKDQAVLMSLKGFDINTELDASNEILMKTGLSLRSVIKYEHGHIIIIQK